MTLDSLSSGSKFLIHNVLFQMCVKGKLKQNKKEQEVIDGLDEEEQERLKQRRAEKKKKEQVEYKKKYLPLMKFLKKNGLKFKAAAVKKHTVQYFRLDHFKLFLEVKKEVIDANVEIKEMLQNWQEAFVLYKRLQNQPQFKWPEELEESIGNQCKFASFKFSETVEGSKKTTILMLLGVISIVLFPLWPYQLKYFIFKLCMYLLIIVTSISLLRIVLYLFGGIFGVSFWLFPNFFQSDSTWESLIPVISVQKWNGSSKETTAVRLVLMILFFYYAYQFYNDPSIISENISITKTILEDIDTWGVSKLKGQRNFSQSALSDYSKMFNETIETEVL